MTLHPLETLLNTFFGSAYYKANHAKKIKAKNADWKNWNGKKALLILSYDIDEQEDVKNLVVLEKLLAKYNIKAVFAAIGLLVKKDPALFSSLLIKGHEIINHTQTHPDSVELHNTDHFHTISSSERKKEIARCHATVKKMLGYEMKGFRIPHFGNQFTDDMYPILEKLGYAYSSSTVAIKTETSGFPYKIGKVWEYPLVCCPKHPFCIFDTSHAFRASLVKHTPEEYIATFKSFLDFAIDNHMFINLYHDPQDIHRFEYEELLKHISKRKNDLWITTYSELTAYLEKNTKKRV
jgi:peptidoglycan-N-acetylglucosamine deacetylase